MKIEETVFQNYNIDKNKLITYGFKKNGNKHLFEKILSKEDFKAVIEFDKQINGKIFDITTDEEYTNFRIENSVGFSSEIREDFIKLLTDIRDNCSEKQLYQSTQTQNINKYIVETYKDSPEFLWEKFPTYAIYRKQENNKWYALFGSVGLNKVDKTSKSTEIVEIINLKIDKNDLDELLNINGIYEAYHMNKKNWVTVILNGTLSDKEICDLVDKSYKNI